MSSAARLRSEDDPDGERTRVGAGAGLDADLVHAALAEAPRRAMGNHPLPDVPAHRCAPERIGEVVVVLDDVKRDEASDEDVADDLCPRWRTEICEPSGHQAVERRRVT